MIDHLTLQVGDTAASRDFYTAVLAPLGLRPAYTDGEGTGFAASDSRAPFWLTPAVGASSRQLHVAFRAASRSAVDDFYAAAVRLDAEVLHAPRIFNEYHPAYYASFVRDPDGNNIEAVCHHAPKPT
ncbi:MAG: VOC family protein [Acidimicrobiales bacterium]